MLALAWAALWSTKPENPIFSIPLTLNNKVGIHNEADGLYERLLTHRTAWNVLGQIRQWAALHLWNCKGCAYTTSAYPFDDPGNGKRIPGTLQLFGDIDKRSDCTHETKMKCMVRNTNLVYLHKPYNFYVWLTGPETEILHWPALTRGSVSFARAVRI